MKRDPTLLFMHQGREWLRPEQINTTLIEGPHVLSRPEAVAGFDAAARMPQPLSLTIC
jgi:hypothetical protein